MDVPFVFSSNGDAFVFHDKTAADGVQETELPMTEFPSPQTLWAKYRAWRGLADNTEEIFLQDYYEAGKTPRYYQQNAINRVLCRIAEGGQSRFTGHGNRHRQNLYRLSDYLAVMESGG